MNEPVTLVPTRKLTRTVPGSAPVAGPSSWRSSPELWVTCRCASSAMLKVPAALALGAGMLARRDQAHEAERDRNAQQPEGPSVAQNGVAAAVKGVCFGGCPHT